MPTIAVVGAGPGLGLAVARAFGNRGYDVALVARNQQRLDELAATLSADGIRAEGFAADVLERPSLTAALDRASSRFGAIDVLEYSPVGSASTTGLASPAVSTVQDVQQQIEFQLYGAMAATAAVLPAMRERGSGTVLITTGAGSIDPRPMLGNVNAAAAALRNWTIGLHKELADSGVYAAHVGIGVSIDTAVVPGVPVAPAAEIAESYWTLHTERRLPEFVFAR